MEIINTQQKICPCCMEQHDVQTVTIRENNVFKGVSVEYKAEYNFCDKANEFYAEEKRNNCSCRACHRRGGGLVCGGGVW